LSELKHDGLTPTSILFYKDVGHSQEGAKEVTQLFDAGVFDGPKPVRLLTRLLTLANLKKDSIVLDFFSGSAATAHALMERNAEDGGHCKFIMVQLPEVTDEGGTAYRAGYRNICEIGKERSRLKQQIKVLEADRQKMETNMSFFTSSNSNSPILKQLQEKLSALQQEIDLVREKVKQIDLRAKEEKAKKSSDTDSTEQ